MTAENKVIDYQLIKMEEGTLADALTTFASKHATPEASPWGLFSLAIVFDIVGGGQRIEMWYVLIGASVATSMARSGGAGTLIYIN